MNVSNYPGTTVEVSKSTAQNLPEITLVDTPGVITFPPHTEDEKVTARLLLKEKLKAIVQVGDAKNIRRTLLLTVQLAEMGVPLVLSLNMVDEAQSRGVLVNHTLLAETLSFPVVPTIAIKGHGVKELTTCLVRATPSKFHLSYPLEIEKVLDNIDSYLTETPIASRALGLLWLSEDETTANWLEEHLDKTTLNKLERLRIDLQRSFNVPLTSAIQKTRLEYVDQLAAQVLLESGQRESGLAVQLGRLATHPLWGLPIMGIVLFALYWFVGFFGSQVLVDFLEISLFQEIINPWITSQINILISNKFIADFLIGEYGLWTMGLTYAIALVFPIVTTFFLAFGIMEDSGYLPLVAVLTNRIFNSLGLNGKAVLPMILGLGCVTMATLTTRVMENKRDRSSRTSTRRGGGRMDFCRQSSGIGE